MSAKAKEMLWSQLGKYKRKIPDPMIPSWTFLMTQSTKPQSLLKSLPSYRHAVCVSLQVKEAQHPLTAQAALSA